MQSSQTSMKMTSQATFSQQVVDTTDATKHTKVTINRTPRAASVCSSGESEVFVETSLRPNYESDASSSASWSTSSSSGSRKRARAVLEDDEPEVYRPLKRRPSEEEQDLLEKQIDEFRATVLASSPRARSHAYIPVRSRAPSPEPIPFTDGYVPSPPWSRAATPAAPVIGATVPARRSSRLTEGQKNKRVGYSAPPVMAPRKVSTPKARTMPRKKATISKEPTVPKAPAANKRKPTKGNKKKGSKRVGA